MTFISKTKPSAIYTLTKNDNPNFFTVLHNRHNRYNIGFSSINHVRHLQYSMNPLYPNLRLTMKKDVPNINIGYVLKSELDMDFGNIYLKPNCQLTIDKKNNKQKTYQKDLVKELTYNICVKEDDSSKFVMYPLIKESGIILPYKIDEEDDNKVLMECNILFPESYLDKNYTKMCVQRMNKIYKNNG